MFELLREKLKTLKNRLLKKQQEEETVETYRVAPPFEEEEEEFELTTSKEDNIFKVEISDYIKVMNYVKRFKEDDPYNLYDSISNNILWNGDRQRVNKGTYFIIYVGNRLYNVLFQDGTIEIDERTRYENGHTDEKILKYDPQKPTYKYCILKHDETGSTYLTKFYDKEKIDMKFFRYPYEDAYRDITDLIANLQTIPNMNRVVNINMLIDGVVKDMEVNPVVYKKDQ